MESAAPAIGQSSPQDYPQWRGQSRDGAASSFSEPATWPDSLTRRWKVDVGDGYATPIVVGSVVYVFTRRDASEVMMALDAGTGKEIWRTSYPAPYTPGSPAAVHGAGPKATPLFYNGTLFSLGISGIVSAFDASSGKLVWQTPAPAEHPFYGASVSPVADKGLVIVHPGNYGPLMFLSNPVIVGETLFGLSHRASGQYFALDARTGTVLWLGSPREATNTAVVKAGRFLFLLNDDAELIVAKSSRTAFEPIKRYTVADSATWAQPAISGNRVFVKDVSSLALWTVD
jgi:hypothetical protein